nr:coenzyme F420-0:L-glutamate ligase [Candidatus Enterousia merdequi]
MTRTIGTAVYGLRAPIFREGDDLQSEIVKLVKNSGLTIKDKDIVAITESVVARCQGNYVTVDEIANETKRITNNAETIIIVNPIFSRNRFAMLLKGIARGVGKKIIISMPEIDEVGNVRNNHPITKMNYDEYYKSIVESENKECVIVPDVNNISFSENDVCIAADIHTREATKQQLKKIGYKFVLSLTDFFNEKCKYGLLGSNKASEERLKLFPNTDKSQHLVESIQKQIKEETGKNIEVMVYGDGCFKDYDTKIWEMADPVPCPAYTAGLKGAPNEIKIKNFADDKFKNLSGEDLTNAIKQEVKNKGNLEGKMESQGTTPRQYTSLLASLCDLTSGSGDKATPIVYIQGYFDNYIDD